MMRRDLLARFGFSVALIGASFSLPLTIAAQEDSGVKNPFAVRPKPGATTRRPAEVEKNPPKEEPRPTEPPAESPKPETTEPAAEVQEDESPAGLGGGQKTGTLWTVEIDPATPLGLDSLKAPISVSGLDAKPDLRWERSRARVLFPELPSVFVGIGLNEKETDVRDVWDLAKNQKIGSISKLALEGSQLMALSPDGHYFVAKPQFDDLILVVDVISGKIVKRLSAADMRLDLLAFSSPNQLLVGENDHLQVFSIPGGAQEQDIAINNWTVRDGWALSAGGKYLAAVTREGEHRKSACLINLSSGEQVGELSLAAGEADCRGLAFSFDGTRLAAAMTSGADGVLEIFDLAGPTVAAEIPFNAALVENPQAYQGRFLDWTPDGQRLLVSGRDMVDLETASTLTSLRDELPYPVRPLTDRLYLSVQGQELAAHSYGAAPSVGRPAASSGTPRPRTNGSTPAVGPPVTTADRSSAKALTLSVPTNWDVRLDAPPSYANALDTNGFRIPAGSIHQVVLSSDDPPSAIVSYAAKPLTQDNTTKTWIEQFDLQSGESRGKTPFPFPSVAAAVSADGKAVATLAADGSGRVDVWSLDLDQHVAGFVPASSSAVDPLPWFVDFVDAEHLLIAVDDELSLWKLPDCKAVYTMTIGAMRPAISPARDHVAVAAPDSPNIVVLESLTGTPRGAMAIGNAAGENIVAAAFHHRGRWLAGLTSGSTGGELVVVDTAAGVVSVRARLPVSADVMQWCGDDSLLLGGSSLVSLTSKAVVWNYNLPLGMHCREPIDAHHWYVAAIGESDKNFILFGASLPEEAITRKIESQSVRNEVLFKPGDSIRLDIQAAAEGDRSVGHLLTEHFTERYESAGSKVEETAQATFAVSPYQSAAATAGRGVPPRKSLIPAAIPSKKPGQGFPPPSNVWELRLASGEEVLWRTWLIADGTQVRLESDESEAAAAVKADMASARTAVAALLAFEPPCYGLSPAAVDAVGTSRLTTTGPRP
jgi:WD40 repeat protein